MTRIIVAGDVFTEHLTYRGHRYRPSDRKPGSFTRTDEGGAAQLARLVEAAFGEGGGVEVVDLSPGGQANCRYSVWSPCAKDAKTKKDDVWRETDDLGLCSRDAGGEESVVIPEHRFRSCDVVVLDDRAACFRFRSEWWPSLLTVGKRQSPWVVLDMAQPLGSGDLWLKLRDQHASRLIGIVSADDLRQGEVMISSGRSWENTVQDLLDELATSACLADLKHCRHLLVSFGFEGALWIDGPGKRDPKATLIFDPGRLEGHWSGAIEGNVRDTGSCLTAGIVHAVVSDPVAPRIDVGTVLGLTAARVMLNTGHGSTRDEEPDLDIEAIAAVFRRDPDTTFSVSELRRPANTRSRAWSLLDSHQVDKPRPLYGEARRVALLGNEAVSGIPFGEFGKLFTVDRSELESFHGIRSLMIDYRDNSSGSKPLSLGVFGPPGAGKSFGIKQIAKGILGSDVKILEFNLAQFGGQDMLIDALHLVRDAVLSNDMPPVIFWDEFDSADRMWLQYLLAPMQDGAFLDGQISHPIGKCIFIFAGGTAYTMESFTPSDPAALADFRRKKGPDFISRLRGYLNVLGPNQRQLLAADGESWADDPTDTGFPIRRALLLRVMSKHFGDKPLHIDFGLLNAFLKIDRYKHGARSLETIIDLTMGAGGLVRSFLPPREQIGLHVDYDLFMDLIQQDQEFKTNCSKLAPAIHAQYAADNAKSRSAVFAKKMFSDLPVGIRADNEAAALRIPEVLALVGLYVVKKKGSKATAPAVAGIIADHLEILARAEHDGWMRSKSESGWTYGKVRDDARKIHDALTRYDDLDDDVKQKDRDAVKNYPEIVARAGFVIDFEGT